MIIRVLGFVLLVASCHGLPMADAQGKYSSAHVIQPKHMATDEYIQSVIDFWTEEKFHQAKSPWELYPDMFNYTKISQRQLDDFHFDENSPAFSVDPVLSAFDSNLKAPAGGYGRPTTGKVFWDVGNNRYGMCSASVIASDNKDLLVTAAHCIFDSSQGGFLVNHNWVFVPGYNHGQRPHGTFPARWMTTFNGWINSNDWNYDIGYVLVSQVSQNEKKKKHDESLKAIIL